MKDVNKHIKFLNKNLTTMQNEIIYKQWINQEKEYLNNLVISLTRSVQYGGRH